MVNFVKPNLLGTQKEFTNRFMNPIKNGQCRDSNPYDIRKMKQRAHVLYMLLQGSVQVSATLTLYKWVYIPCFPWKLCIKALSTTVFLLGSIILINVYSEVPTFVNVYSSLS